MFNVHGHTQTCITIGSFSSMVAMFGVLTLCMRTIELRKDIIEYFAIYCYVSFSLLLVNVSTTICDYVRVLSISCVW